MSTRARSFEGFLRGRRRGFVAADPRRVVAACAAVVRLAWDVGGPDLQGAVPGADEVEAALGLVERWAAGGAPPEEPDPFLPAVQAAARAGSVARTARLAALAALGLDPEIDDAFDRAPEVADAAAGTPFQWVVAAEPAADAVWFLAILAKRVATGQEGTPAWRASWTADLCRRAALVLYAAGERERRGRWGEAEHRVAVAVGRSLRGVR
mgnify:FL=1